MAVSLFLQAVSILLMLPPGNKKKTTSLVLSAIFGWISLRIHIFHLRAYDKAAIKFRGVDADINFSVRTYEEDIKQVR